MHVTQGTFSYLPALTDEQIAKQIQYALDHGWPISLEWTDDPHPRNSYWEMCGQPLFDVHDAAEIMRELAKARDAHPGVYIKLNAYDARYGRQTTALSFIVQRPGHEPGFHVERQAGPDRTQRYTIASYATGKPHGERYR